MDGGLLCLKWRDHRSTFFRILSSVRKKEMYCDATIACDGQFYPVHKLVLSTCSEYFEQIFEVADKQHLMIVLADIQHEDLETLLDYMYMGEVNVMQSDLSGFMKAAECLKIKGLAEPMETNPRKEYIESKRSYSRREDGWESKRRKQNDETSGYSFSESKTIQRSSCDSPGPVKVPMGNEESYIEPKRHKDKMGEHTKTSISTTGIISPPPLLASAEVTSKTLLGLGPDFLPTLSRCHEGSASCDGEITDCDSSQVKFEDVNVKEEPEDWSQGGCTGDSQLFRFSDPGLTCLANTSTLPVAAPDSWEFDRVTKAQPGPLNHPASSVPGPSGSQSRKIGRPTSGIWNHYISEKIDGKTVVYCKYCTLKYSYPNATKMKAHILKCDICPEDVRRQFKDVKQEIEHFMNHTSKEIWGAVPVESYNVTQCCALSLVNKA